MANNSKNKTPLSRYQAQLVEATSDANTFSIFENGWGLIEGPRYTQGIWISPAIIAQWRLEKWL